MINQQPKTTSEEWENIIWKIYEELLTLRGFLCEGGGKFNPDLEKLKTYWLSGKPDWEKKYSVDDIIQFLILQKQKEAIWAVLPEERGIEEQEKLCGLYHWNDCRREIIKKAKELYSIDL